MNFLNQLIQHDSWTTQQLLNQCAELSDVQLDQQTDIGHKTIRQTLNHVIRNMDIWSAIISDELTPDILKDEAAPTLHQLSFRFRNASKRLAQAAEQIELENRWDEAFEDPVDGIKKERGLAIAHILTHSMHHRAQLLYMMRRIGLTDLPEGDVFSWHQSTCTENQ